MFCSQILVPVPQYPLYSATITLFGGSLVPYYLEETANWGLDIANLRQSVAQARSQGITVSMTLFSLIIDIHTDIVFIFDICSKYIYSYTCAKK